MHYENEKAMINTEEEDNSSTSKHENQDNNVCRFAEEYITLVSKIIYNREQITSTST